MSINLRQRSQEYTTKTRQSLQQAAGQPRINQGARTLPHTLHKNKLKTAATYIRHDTIKLVEENTGKTFSNVNHSIVFLVQSPKTTNKNKTYKLLHSKVYHIQNEKTTCGLGENACK